MKVSDLTFLIDLNDIERDDTTSVHMDFTNNSGPGVSVRTTDAPLVGALVRVIDDRLSVYDAEIVDVASERDFVVRIDWASERVSINETITFDAPRKWTTAESLTYAASNPQP